VGEGEAQRDAKSAVGAAATFISGPRMGGTSSSGQLGSPTPAAVKPRAY
jgi:hypothetical protein